MRRHLFVITSSMWLAAAGLTTSVTRAQGTAPSPSASSAPHAEVVKQYCLTCHNDRLKTAGLSLEHLDVANPPAFAETWEKVLRKLRRGSMPPQGVRRPDDAAYNGLIAWLESEIDRAAAAHPNPGRPLPHRLNRVEYANAIRDLLALDVGDVASLLPPDDSAYGFDNMAEALGVSSVLMERYVSAAGRISALAVGDPDVAPGSDTFVLRQDFSQDQHVEGQPFGTVGGLITKYTFPLDAEYILSATLMRTNVDATRGLEDARQVEFTVDGERVFLTSIGGTSFGLPGGERGDNNKPKVSRSDAADAQLRVRIPVKAGARSVGVSFLQRSLGENTRRLQPFRSSFDTYDASGMPHIRTLSITGPFKASGPGDTPSRRRIFICRPSDPGARGSEEACASEIMSALARRAYRKPPTADDVQNLLEFFRAGRKDGTFDTGIERALQRLLASPKFTIRVEQPRANAVTGSAYNLSDYDLASRLSFFIWSSIPDDELLRTASEGRLSNPAVLDRQVRRMLADAKSSALVTNFSGQWLQLRNLRNTVPNEDLFPAFDDNLRQAMQRETELLFDSIVREDRNVVDLLTADYTFVNERLAKHYKIPNVYGSQFRRVPITDEARRGLLGQASILTLTSNANRTSPVLRGKWILSNLVGAPPPPPPPGVPPLKENTEGAEPVTMRAMMEQHRKDPVCAGCHKVMDPFGFALENYDAVGRYRERDGTTAVDASGVFLDGSPIEGVAGLRDALVKRPEIFVGTLTEKLLTYGLGRGLGYYDMPAVRKIVRDASAREYRFSSLILGIASSVPFQKGIVVLEDQAPVKTAAR
jgi:mono/diheme cytochrome c family protein